MRKRKRKVSGKAIKKALTAPAETEFGNVTVPTGDLLSCGYTPLDVCISGRAKGGYGKGLYILVVGDSEAGKTWLAYTCLAEAARNPAFADHAFVVDMPENGALMDTTKYYGQAVTDRIVPPRGTPADPVHSETVEDLYYHIDEWVSKGPCIYIIDSMDVLDSEADAELFEAKKNERLHGGAKAKGTMGTQKAKANSQGIRRLMQKLRKSGSILIVISQTRDNIGFGFNPKTRSGGKALKFAAHVEFWLSVKETLKKRVKGKERPVGNVVQIKVAKNRLSGWKGTVEMPFLRNYGIDNVGGMVDFLVEEGRWKKGKGGIKTGPDLDDLELDRDELVANIEANGLEGKVKKACRACWLAIEKECATDRKPRYT